MRKRNGTKDEEKIKQRKSENRTEIRSIGG
jgi:hypothetical protein